MTERHPKVQSAVDESAQTIFGRTLTEAKAHNICVDCGEAVTDGSFTDDLSKVEYGISGFCQKCQDIIFAEPEDEDEGLDNGE